MSALLQQRISRLQRLMRFRERLIRVNGSLEAAKLDPRWNDIQILIGVLTNRISISIESPDVSQPLTAPEIAFIVFLLNQINEL